MFRKTHTTAGIGVLVFSQQLMQQKALLFVRPDSGMFHFYPKRSSSLFSTFEQLRNFLVVVSFSFFPNPFWALFLRNAGVRNKCLTLCLVYFQPSHSHAPQALFFSSGRVSLETLIKRQIRGGLIDMSTSVSSTPEISLARKPSRLIGPSL